jgi:Ricin-type beta-trefoil lectin domain-like
MSLTVSIATYGGWLDLPGSSAADGAQVQVYDQFHGGANQQWELIPGPVDGPETQAYQVRSVSSGLMLDVQNGHVWWNDIVVQQYHETGGNNQFWWFERFTGSNPYRSIGFGFGFSDPDIWYWIHPRFSGKVLEVANIGITRGASIHDPRDTPSVWMFQAVNLGGRLPPLPPPPE